MNVSSISEIIKPTFEGRIKRAREQLSYLTTPTGEKNMRNPYLIYDTCEGAHEADECDSNESREQGEEGSEWVVRSKFEDELSKFMLEKDLWTTTHDPAYPISPSSAPANETRMTIEKENPNDGEAPTTQSLKDLESPTFYHLSKSSSVPFPSWLKKQKKDDEDERLLSIFRNVISWKKEEIVLGHKVSGSGIKVDRAKIESISKLPYPTNIKAIHSFLGHAGFYRRFIKDFSQIARSMTQLLVKDTPFIFTEECIQAFDRLKQEWTQAPINIKPNCSLPFEIMCDASYYAVGAVPGQKNKHFQPIHYASKTMNKAHENYTTTEKELLAVVFSFNTFRQYLVLFKTIIFTDHSALRYLFAKQDAKPCLIRWILLVQELDIEIRDKKGVKNLAADHLSRLKNPDLGKLTRVEIRDMFPKKRLMLISDGKEEPWYADFANYLASRVLPF
ncbi:reverse transcriptase domain-containing protein [Tanacetum coccineum]